METKRFFTISKFVPKSSIKTLLFLATYKHLDCRFSQIRAVSDRFLGVFNKNSTNFGQERPFPGLVTPIEIKEFD